MTSLFTGSDGTLYWYSGARSDSSFYWFSVPGLTLTSGSDLSPSNPSRSPSTWQQPNHSQLHPLRELGLGVSPGRFYFCLRHFLYSRRKEQWVAGAENLNQMLLRVSRKERKGRRGKKKKKKKRWAFGLDSCWFGPKLMNARCTEPFVGFFFIHGVVL